MTQRSYHNKGMSFDDMQALANQHAESVAEELRLNGFPVETEMKGAQTVIVFENISGTMRFSCSETTVMGDFYRFVSHYGTNLQQWGLENKIKAAKGRN